MAANSGLRILVATDGSPSATAAIDATLKFPWPRESKAGGVVARFPWLRTESEAAQIMLDHAVESAATAARKRLARRWRDIHVAVVDEPPGDAILGEAERFGADIVVLGWRGHGTFHRLLAGSVSRSVAAKAKCAVLVVRECPRVLRRFVLAYDGSPNAHKAVDLLMALEPRRGSRVIVATVVEPLWLPASSGILPRSLQMELRQSVADQNAQQLNVAQEAAATVAAQLQNRGWSTSVHSLAGAPVATLLKVLAEQHADVVLAGASTKTGIQRAVLGSVASALLNQSPVPVLIVR